MQWKSPKILVPKLLAILIRLLLTVPSTLATLFKLTPLKYRVLVAALAGHKSQTTYIVPLIFTLI